MREYRGACICVDVLDVYIYIYIHIHTHIYIFNKNERIPRGMSTIHCSADVRTTDHGENASRAWIHVYIYKYVYIYVSIYKYVLEHPRSL